MLKIMKDFLHSKYYWWTILLAGYLLRIIAGWFLQEHQLPDVYSQHMPLAEAFASGAGYHDKTPGFILFLTPIVILFGKGHYIYPAILLQGLTSLLLCYVLYKITAAIFRSETAGRLAAGIGAFYPWLIYYSAQLSLEHWFVLWVSLSVYYSIRLEQKRDYLSAFILGAVFGFTLWIRSAFAPYILAAAIVFLWRQIAWSKILLVLLTTAVIVQIWCGYSYFSGGGWRFTTDNAMSNLYFGLNPLNKTGGATVGEDSLSYAEIAEIMQTLPPEKQKTWYQDQVIQFVRENPKQVLILAVKKMWIFWRPYPRSAEHTNPLTILIIFCSFVPLALGSLYTLWIFRGDKNYTLLVYPIIYIAQLNALHLVFAGSLVYRFPIEPLLICLASYSFSYLWENKQ